MRIPEDKIEDVRAATDILTVVQGYVALKRRGQNYFGLCPFHSDSAPSFAVNPARQIFRCFGCGRGGNVFGFVMEIERISFVEAVRMLAERAGIELPAVSANERDAASESEELVRANGMARDFFHKQLMESQSPGAIEARRYLAERGYGKTVIEHFLLGYAPDSWDSLLQYAKQAGLAPSILMQAGLLKEGKERNRPYDAFRHRVMFPIRNLAGRVIAFGGRRLREEEEAKYINSPETAVYRKGRELFGLWEARQDIRTRDEAILVEGYTDCLSLVMAGVTITVASLGTALTEQQAKLLKRFTDKVYILYDGDNAGLNAARRAIDVLIAAGAKPRALVLPGTEDPDSFVRKSGGEAIWQLRESAFSPVDFQLHLARHNQMSMADAARELLNTAALIASPVEQDIFLREISARTAVSADALRRELSRVRGPGQTPEEKSARTPWPPQSTLSALTRVLVRRGELRPLVFQKWSPQNVADAKLAELLNHLYQEWRSNAIKEPESLLDRFPDSPLREFLAGCLYETEDDEDEQRGLEIDRRMALDCLRGLEADGLRGEIAELKRKLAASPDEPQLLRALQELVKREKSLRIHGQNI